VFDGYAGLDGHEAEHGEDDEAAKHARRTVDQRHDHRVSARARTQHGCEVLRSACLCACLSVCPLAYLTNSCLKFTRFLPRELCVVGVT